MSTTSCSYVNQDIIAIKIARWYANERGQPFAVMIGNFPDYDLQSSDGSTRIELKVETTPIRTQNACIEYWNTSLGAPSGVLATRADIWLHVVLEESGFIGYEFDVDVLRKLAIEEGVIKSNGRNSLSRIIPLETIRKYAKRTISFPSSVMETKQGESHARYIDPLAINPNQERKAS